MNIQCPCCFNFSLDIDENLNGIVEICAVCFHQYDKYCLSAPCRCTGPNPVTLFEARQNYIKMGAADERSLKYVRKPKINELPENNEYLFYDKIKIRILNDKYTCLGVLEGDVGDVVQILVDSTYVVDFHKGENKFCRIWTNKLDFEFVK